MIIPIEVLKDCDCFEQLEMMSQEDEFVKTVSSGLILWEDEPEKWGGPFADKYAFYKIENFPNHRLEPMECIFAKLHSDCEHSIFNLPQEIRKRFTFSGLTHQEYLRLMEELRYEFIPISEWKRNINKDIKLRLDEEIWHSIERPVLFGIYGNDDCSYSQTFETEETALKCLNCLDHTATWVNLLEKLQFKFTN